MAEYIIKVVVLQQFVLNIKLQLYNCSSYLRAGQSDRCGQEDEDDVLAVGRGCQRARVRVVLSVAGEGTDSPLHGFTGVQVYIGCGRCYIRHQAVQGLQQDVVSSVVLLQDKSHDSQRNPKMAFVQHRVLLNLLKNHNAKNYSSERLPLNCSLNR